MHFFSRSFVNMRAVLSLFFTNGQMHVRKWKTIVKIKFPLGQYFIQFASGHKKRWWQHFNKFPEWMIPHKVKITMWQWTQQMVYYSNCIRITQKTDTKIKISEKSWCQKKLFHKFCWEIRTKSGTIIYHVSVMDKW